MAEFIFDLQRFPDDGGDGNNSGAGNEGGDSDGDSGGNSSASGEWEANIRKRGQILFPMFMDLATADAFTYDAHNIFVDALDAGLVPVTSIKNGIADSFDFSRFTGSVDLYNDSFDVINLVDVNVGNIIEYWIYGSLGGDKISDSSASGNDRSEYLALIFDTGAVLRFDIGEVSPWFNFANGESMIYRQIDHSWISGEEAEAAFIFWNSANILSSSHSFAYSDNYDVLFPYVDNFAISQTVNNAIMNPDDYDNILLYDATTADVAYTTEVTDSSITIYFPAGGALVVDNRDADYSPNFFLADGSSYYYNNNLEEWRLVSQKDSDIAEYTARTEAEEAAAKALYESAYYAAGYNVVVEADATYDAEGYKVTEFPLSVLNSNYIYDTKNSDTIYFADAVFANVVDMSAEGDDLNFTFSNGITTTIEYDNVFSPVIKFADGNATGYDWYTQNWGTAYVGTSAVDTFTLSRGDNSLVYFADWDDSIYFSDALLANITDVVAGSTYIHLYFDTGAITSVRYDDVSFTPDFVFADGTRYYYNNNTGRWRAYTLSNSADLASDDLWGDTFSGTAAADEIFVGTAGNTLVQNVDAQDTIALGAALSDIVETSVTDNTIAIAFNTGVTAVIETSGTSPTFNLSSGESYSYDKQSASWKSA